MATAHHNLSGSLVQQILETTPPLAEQIRLDPQNREFTERGWEPVYSASPHARIVVIGQAPGRAAQESRIPWNDPSGVKLREWMGVTDEQFYNPELISLLPMDFYYPGKGARGDNPPRKDFAPKWHPQLLPLVHPSPLNFRWRAKNPWFEQEVIPALQKRVGEVLKDA